MGKPNKEKYITGDTLANEIKQTKTTLAFVVEGHSDVVFYRSMTHDGACKFFDAGGKQNLLDAIRIINSNPPDKIHYLGVVDTDFDVIENVPGSPSYPNNVFPTDGHDMEMMCLIPNVWRKIYNEHFADKEKITLEELKARVTEDASALAYLHLASKRENWGMSIKSKKNDKEYMSISKLYDRASFKMLPFHEIATKVNSNNPITGFNAEVVSKKMNAIKDEHLDVSHLLNGHHIALILVEYMKQFGKHTSSDNHDSLSREIRLAYNVDDFHKTALFSSLYDFQTSKGIVFLL